MTKKDYIALAVAFARSRPEMRDAAKLAQWQRDRDSVALTLSMDNPRFDRDRFIAATLQGS